MIATIKTHTNFKYSSDFLLISFIHLFWYFNVNHGIHTPSSAFVTANATMLKLYIILYTPVSLEPLIAVIITLSIWDKATTDNPWTISGGDNFSIYFAIFLSMPGLLFFHIVPNSITPKITNAHTYPIMRPNALFDLKDIIKIIPNIALNKLGPAVTIALFQTAPSIMYMLIIAVLT